MDFLEELGASSIHENQDEDNEQDKIIGGIMFKWNEDTKIKKIESWFLKTIQTCNKNTKNR